MSDISDENAELCADFVIESREMIGEVEPILVEVEAEAANSGEVDMSQIDAIFRAFHSMKGSGGFLDLNSLVSVTHQAESLLDLFRRGKATLAPRHITVLCKAMDFILELLDQIEHEYHDTGREEEAEALVAAIRAEMENSDGPTSANPTGDSESDAVEAAADKTGSDPETGQGNGDAASSDTGDSMLITPELIEGFIVDAVEGLDAAESALLALEADPADEELIAVAFRSLHSFKGNCGFFGFAEMERIAHKMETTLDDSRESGAPPDEATISQLLADLDKLRGKTNALAEGEGEGDTEAVTAEPQEETSAAPAEPLEESAAPVDANETAAAPKAPASAPKSEKSRKPATGNIRVDLDKLDSLMDLVGELILAETMVTHNPDLEGHVFEDFQKASLQLNRITRSIQDVAMSVRMVPIAGTFRKMLRLVRDLAQKQEKRVDLVLVGEETEIDKTVVEAIADPLVHLIRNSVDHGIESPEERKASGKPESGTIRLQAKHEGGRDLDLDRG